MIAVPKPAEQGRRTRCTMLQNRHLLSFFATRTSMQITPLASTISDNWFYAIEDAGDLLLVDPIDAPVAIAHVKARTPKRVRIFNTHGHPDHIGGNDAVVEALDCEVIASGHPDIADPEAQHRVKDGDTVTVGQSVWNVLHAPGHTMGHIVLHHLGHLISGDVLFVGGVGNCRFGGDPDALFTTVHQIIAQLPSDTIFYPGHDYALRNGEFCLEVDPSNKGAQEMIDAARTHHGDDPRRAPFLRTLGQERAYNPFMRASDPTVQQQLKTRLSDSWPADDNEAARAAFKALRAARDAF